MKENGKMIKYMAREITRLHKATTKENGKAVVIRMAKESTSM